jgi:hypothetical protein
MSACIQMFREYFYYTKYCTVRIDVGNSNPNNVFLYNIIAFNIVKSFSEAKFRRNNVQYAQ